jgi:hypothetical protein
LLETVSAAGDIIDVGMFPIRVLSPALAIVVAGYYFLPETSSNVLALVRRYEERVPVVWDVHRKVREEVEIMKKETVKEMEHVSEKLGIKKQ